MSSRMDKYYKENTLEESRTKKNKEIYNKINSSNIENLSLTSNISIIDTDTTNLDINKLKKILDEKYTDEKKVIELPEDSIDENEDLEDTKEYDLKKIIEAAHKNKDSNYDRERFEKLRDTQYDILNSLNLERESEPEIEESLTVEETNLMNLIKTINDNTLKQEQNNSIDDDILIDLKENDSDNSETLEPMTFTDDDLLENKPSLNEELEKTKKLSKKEILDNLEIEEEKTQNVKENETLENTFYTGSYKIEDSDLDDFESLKKEIKSGNVLLKILSVLLLLLLIGVAIYFVNKYFKLGLF